MQLKNLIDYNSKDLVHCSICAGKTAWKIAAQEGWVMDTDAKNIFYCPECKKFLINKLDDADTLC